MKILILCAFFVSFYSFTSPVLADKDARYYLKQASKYYNNRDYIKAQSAFQKVLKMNVTLHDSFYYFYGKTLFKNGDYRKAALHLSTYTETASVSKYTADATQLLRHARKQLEKEALQEKPRKQKPIKASNVPEMVKIPVGSFFMGSTHGTEDQRPVHKVTFKKEFGFGKYEVTFTQYDVFAKATDRKLPDDHGWGRANRPVINVSLIDANDYARWLSKKTNRHFRLPTEAEWEYVAQTGFKTRLGFNALMGLGDANCDGCRHFWESAQTKLIGQYEANEYGVHDIFGNVWEWTCSIYTRQYGGNEELECIDEDGLEGETISIRGGGWDSSSPLLRSFSRLNNFPTYYSNELGFRLVEEL